MRLISESDYIAHHGIKGQKWGVRRYQNADGTLTEAGKKRYLKEFKKAEDNQLKQYRDSKNKKEAFDSLHRFVRLTKNAIGEDVLRRTDEFKKYESARKNLEDYEEMLRTRLVNKGLYAPGNDQWEREWDLDKGYRSREEAYAKASTAYTKKIGEVYLANKGALVNSKLRDLGFPTNDINLNDLYQEYHLSKFPWDTTFQMIN